MDIHTQIGRLGPRHSDTLSAEQLMAKKDAWGIDRACG